MESLELRTLPLAQLTPAAYNPRKPVRPTDRAYRKLRRSLEEFGLVEPLVWNESTGRVVGGHLRLQILQELGRETVPVSVVRLSEARERALNLVLNHREAQGRFDPAKLAAVLRELEPLPELEASGFTAGDLRALELTPADPPPEDAAPDAVEVTLRVPRDRYAAVQADLDALIGRYDLEVHVRG